MGGDEQNAFVLMNATLEGWMPHLEQNLEVVTGHPESGRQLFKHDLGVNLNDDVQFVEHKMKKDCCFYYFWVGVLLFL